MLLVGPQVVLLGDDRLFVVVVVAWWCVLVVDDVAFLWFVVRRWSFAIYCLVFVVSG